MCQSTTKFGLAAINTITGKYYIRHINKTIIIFCYIKHKVESDYFSLLREITDAVINTPTMWFWKLDMNSLNKSDKHLTNGTVWKVTCTSRTGTHMPTGRKGCVNFRVHANLTDPIITWRIIGKIYSLPACQGAVTHRTSSSVLYTVFTINNVSTGCEKHIWFL